MTWRERFPWLAALAPWVLTLLVAGGLVLAGFFAVGYVNRLRARASSAERQAEAAELRAAGFAAARDATQKQLDAAVASNQLLEAEVERLKKARPGTQVVGTVTGSTGMFVPPTPLLQSPLVPEPPAVAGGAPPEARPCLVFVGEPLDIRMTGALARTPEGALVAAGVASLWVLPRGASEPVKAWESPLHLQVQAEPPKAEKGWAAGALALAGRDGWGVGPALSPPAAHFLGLDFEGIGGVSFGPGGFWAAALAGLVRW